MNAIVLTLRADRKNQRQARRIMSKVKEVLCSFSKANITVVEQYVDEVQKTRCETMLTEAIITDAYLETKAGEDVYGTFHFEFCDPEFRPHCASFSMRIKTDCRIDEKGVLDLKHNLFQLGYEPKYSQLKQILNEISTRKPGVIVEITHDGRTSDWATETELWIKSRCENEVIREYRESHL